MVLSYLNIRIMAQRVFLAHGYKRQPMQVCHFDCHKINWMPISLSLKTAEQCWTSFLEVWRIPECVPLPVSFFIHHWFAVLCLHGMLRLTQTVTVAVTLEMMKPETVDPFVFILAYIHVSVAEMFCSKCTFQRSSTPVQMPCWKLMSNLIGLNQSLMSHLVCKKFAFICFIFYTFFLS